MKCQIALAGIDPSLSGVKEPQVGAGAVAPTKGAVGAVAVKFCRVCGAPWVADWTECLSCRRGSARARMDGQAARDNSRVVQALALYFAMLLSAIVGIILRIVYHDLLWPVVAIELLDVVIVVCWAAAVGR